MKVPDPILTPRTPNEIGMFAHAPANNFQQLSLKQQTG